MKGSLIILLATLLINSSDKTTNGSIERFFYTSAELSTPDSNVGMYVNWESGEKTIFRYVLTHPDEEYIADDELSEIFWVEIPSDINEFEFQTSDLNTDSDIEVYYTRACFCYFEAFTFKSVNVSGKKKNNSTWEVAFEMTATLPSDENEYQLKDKGVYTQNAFNW